MQVPLRIELLLLTIWGIIATDEDSAVDKIDIALPAMLGQVATGASEAKINRAAERQYLHKLDPLWRW